MRLILISKSGSRIVVDPSKGDVHTNKGVIHSDEIEPGKVVKTHKGEEFLVVAPGIKDTVEIMNMGAKPLFGYDSLAFAYLINLDRGNILIEAGTGSGGATLVFSKFISQGKVYSFEKEKKFYKIAKENLSGVGNVALINDDVSNASKYVDRVDAIFLDLQNPEHYINTLSSLLKPGGYIGVYSPILDPVRDVWKEMESNGFLGISGIGTGFRKLVVKKYARFSQRLFGFPGFFVWGMKGF